MAATRPLPLKRVRASTTVWDLLGGRYLTIVIIAVLE